MAAVGWYVQLVHYPGFRLVPSDRWGDYHALHMRGTGLVVVAPMLAQSAATVMLLAEPSPGWLAWTSLALLAASVGWTFLVSGPLHRKLDGPESPALDRLIVTNWPRAVAWTAQAGIAAWAVLASIPN